MSQKRKISRRPKRAPISLITAAAVVVCAPIAVAFLHGFGNKAGEDTWKNIARVPESISVPRKPQIGTFAKASTGSRINLDGAKIVGGSNLSIGKWLDADSQSEISARNFTIE